jgi:hypothetical protein
VALGQEAGALQDVGALAPHSGISLVLTMYAVDV